MSVPMSAGPGCRAAKFRAEPRARVYVRFGLAVGKRDGTLDADAPAQWQDWSHRVQLKLDCVDVRRIARQLVDQITFQEFNSFVPDQNSLLNHRVIRRHAESMKAGGDAE